MVDRLIKPLKSDSFFVFGARGTGKSTFISDQFLLNSNCLKIDLLDSDSEEKYSRDPGLIEREIEALRSRPEWVFIDEIQRVPKLLNHVHRLIENQKQKFVLTGSSSRKLKREGANLLAGRAFVNHLYPLTHSELNKDWDFDRALNWGTLPKTYFGSSDLQRGAFLKSYVQTYIMEEIRVEQLVRDLDPFRDFLEVAAQMNGKILNYSKIAKDVGTTDKSIRNYFEILQDTYLGFYLPAFHRSVRKAQAEHPKFFLFDLGVKRQLERTIESKLVPSTFAFGEAFEHLVIVEMIRLANYYQKNWTFSYFRTKEGNEIDLIVSPNRREEILIEIKSTTRVDTAEVKYLAQLSESFRAKAIYYLSLDSTEQVIGPVRCLPWQKGISQILHD